MRKHYASLLLLMLCLFCFCGLKGWGQKLLMTDDFSVAAQHSISSVGWTAKASSYLLDIKTGENFTNWLTDHREVNDGNLTRSSVTGLPALTFYHHRVPSVTTSGSSGMSGHIVVTTLVTEPSVQSNITFGTVTSSSIVVNFSGGDGAKRLVVAAPAAVTGVPADGAGYNANAAYGSGSTLGNGRVVYAGAGNSVTVTSLSPNTTYHFAVYEFNDNGANAEFNYLTVSPGTNSVATAELIYYSQGSGSPNSLSNWNTVRTGGGSSPSGFTAGDFVIQNGHTLTTTGTWIVGANGEKLHIENGGSLIANHQVTVIAGTTFQMDEGSTYIQNVAMPMASSIFQGAESFHANSTIEITVNPSGTSAPTGGYGHLKINVTSGVSNFNWGSNVLNVKGNLTIMGTGSGSTRHALTAGANITIAIGGDFIISGGNFWLSSGAGTCTLNVTGNIVVNGGTLDLANSSGAANVNLLGNLSLSSGTLLSTTAVSTVNLNGVGKVFTHSGGTLTNSNINWVIGSSASITLASALPVAASRSLTVNGSLNAGTNAITGAGSFVLESAGTIISAHVNGLTGSVTTTSKTFSSAAAYVFSGGSSGTFTTTPTANTVGSLVINNTSGDVTLAQPLTVNGAFTLTSGRLLLGANNMTLGAASTTGAGSAASHIVTNGTGSVVRLSLTGEQLFPIGAVAGSYSPITIINTSVITNWTVNVVSGISQPTAHSSRAVQRTWNITPSNSTPGATGIIFQYNESDANIQGVNWNTSADVLVNHYNSATQRWEIANGMPQSQTPSGNANGIRTVSLTGQTSFSPFAISLIGSPLPVTFLHFTGKRDGSTTLLKWTTANESNNKGFEVERSADGRSFVKVAFIRSAVPSGNSATALSYTYTDITATTGGSFYYRLRQVDIDGRSMLSPIVLVRRDQIPVLQLQGIYPNPVSSGQAIVMVEVPTRGDLTLVLTDANGSTLLRKVVSAEAGSNSLPLQTGSLPAGVYYLQAYSEVGGSTNKLKLLKQ